MKAQPLPGKYLEMLAEININTSFAEYCEETEKLSWLRYYKYDNKVQPSSLSGPLKNPIICTDLFSRQRYRLVGNNV